MWLYRDDAWRARRTSRPVQQPVVLAAPLLAAGGIGRGVAWGGMAASPPPPHAGGFLIAAAVIIGAIAGVVLGQPTIGVLAGTTLGIAGALIVWARDRGRPG
jgi:hypothetical protein